MPVWFIHMHPMRVFKWTLEFDPFFESPIAAIWCKLVGLRIHLFQRSGLFAIGGLLGTSILADHDTIAQKRLSFARICVEIDISKSPSEEIVIDIQGKKFRQRVKWDRIPQYCQECKHVGHSREVYYANGTRKKPPRRDYNNLYAKKQQSEGKTQVDSNKRNESSVSKTPLASNGHDSRLGDGLITTGGDDLPLVSGGSLVSGAEEGGFETFWGRRGRHGGTKGRGKGRGMGRSYSFDRGRGGRGYQGAPGGSSVESSYGRFGILGTEQGKEAGEVAEDVMQGSFSNPMFLKRLPNGDFEDEVYVRERLRAR